MWPWEITIWGRSRAASRAIAAIRSLPDHPDSIPLAWAIAHKFRGEAIKETLWLLVWCLLAVHASITWCWWVLEQ